MRVLLFSFMLLITCANIAQVPDSEIIKIGEYASFEKMFDAYAYVSKDTSEVYLYRIEPTIVIPQNFHGSYKPKIYISCTPTMMEDFNKICTRYKEWAIIAKENNVGKMKKVIEQDVPIALLSLHKNAKGYPKFKEFNTKRFTFNVPGIGKTPTLIIHDSFVDDLTKIEVMVSLVFKSPEEFEAFIDIIDPKKALKRIKEGKTSLFTQESHNEKQEQTLPIIASNSVQQEAPKVTKSISKERKRQIANEALERWKAAAMSVKVTR